jgi:hypothetical protein
MEYIEIWQFIEFSKNRENGYSTKLQTSLNFYRFTKIINMEALRFSESSVIIYRTTRRHILNMVLIPRSLASHSASQELPNFYETRIFITASTTNLHSFLS